MAMYYVRADLMAFYSLDIPPLHLVADSCRLKFVAKQILIQDILKHNVSVKKFLISLQDSTTIPSTIHGNDHEIEHYQQMNSSKRQLIQTNHMIELSSDFICVHTGKKEF